MKIKIKSLLVCILISSSMIGCTRVNEGYAGVAQSRFSGDYKEDPVYGWTETFTKKVTEVSTRNIPLEISSNPVIKEGIPMANLQVKVNYGIVPEYAPFIYKTEKGQHIITEDGDVYLLGNYVKYVANSAISDVMSRYPAMEVNKKRDEIEMNIRLQVIKKLTASKKNQYVNINEVNLLSIIPPTSITESIEKIIRTENEKTSKVNELEVAKLEKQKMEILSSQADSQYVELIKAQALMECAKNKCLMTYVVPSTFTSVGTISQK